MNPVLLDLGFVKIYWYSIMILLGIFVGGSFIIKESRRFKIPDDYTINLILLCMLFGILGARLYYVAFNWSYYSHNLLEIIKIWEGGLAIHGGILFGLIFIIFYTKKYKVNTWRMLDIVVVGLIIGQAIGRWGNFFNGEAHGPATTLETLQNLFIPGFIIDGMNIHGTYYHPTFLYESVWNFIGFILMLIFRRFRYIKEGQITGFYLMWYSLGRFYIESLRMDSLLFGEFKVAQLVSIVMFLTGFFLIIFRMRTSKFDYLYNKEEENEF